MNKRKSTGVLLATLATLISLNVYANVNPFPQATALATKYLPSAVIKMWETEHLTWRAQLLYAACTDDFQPINQEMQASFSLVHDYILDQAILNGEIVDDAVKLALQDAAKLQYKIYSSAYRYGYIHRVKILQKFHPDINPALCDDAKDMAQQFPADVQPILPWQHTGSLKGVKWRDNIFAMRIINKRFFPAYLARQQQFAHVIDAQIYAVMNNDDKSYRTFSELSKSSAFQKLLTREMSQAYQLDRSKELPSSPWISIYTYNAEKWARQAYMQSTISVLKRVEEKDPKIYQNIKRHMKSYIELQLNGLEADKARLKQGLEEI